MTDVPGRAIIMRKFTHIVVSRFSLSEPKVQGKGWADATAEHWFEDTSSGNAVPFQFAKAMLLYPGLNYAYDLHMASLEAAFRWLDREATTESKRLMLTSALVDLQPAKGRLDIVISTNVPREMSLKAEAGVSLFVNNETEHTVVRRALDATNVAMFVQLAGVVRDFWRKSKAAVVPPQDSQK